MKTKKLVFVSIFIALVFVATFSIKIPIVIGSGYVHLGDAIVMLAGMLLGPIYGAVASGIGSGLADYSAGYAVYMLPTFIIKGALALFVGIAYKDLKGKLKDTSIIKTIYHVVIAIVIVVGGYFLTDLFMANFVVADLEGSTTLAYAAFGIPWNTIQVTFGSIVSILLYVPLKKPFESIYK